MINFSLPISLAITLNCFSIVNLVNPFVASAFLNAGSNIAPFANMTGANFTASTVNPNAKAVVPITFTAGL